MARHLMDRIRADRGEPMDAPTADDYAACLVALDLVEEGRTREAEQLLIQQAPRRHNLWCPVCGAMAGRPCTEMVMKSRPWRSVSAWRYKGSDPAKDPKEEHYYARVDRIVPHLARVEPGGAG